MKMKENIPLSGFTTMRVGGPARFFCEVRTIEELREAALFARERGAPFFILGGGSNIIVGDGGFPGVVIKMNIRGVSFKDGARGKARVSAGAGEDWDSFVANVVGKNLYGLENLSLIPGSVGAAPVQNIGAYGAEIKNVIEEVRVFDAEAMKERRFSAEECGFRYRDSVFKRNSSKNLIITGASFALPESGKVNVEYRDVREYFGKRNTASPEIGDVRKAVVAIRTAKLPDMARIGTAGSFFKNPVVERRNFESIRERRPDIPNFPLENGMVKVPLAWVLDALGLKGFRCGRAALYEKQPLVIVNCGGASAREIKDFAEEVRGRVYKAVGILPEYEITFVGEL